MQRQHKLCDALTSVIVSQKLGANICIYCHKPGQILGSLEERPIRENDDPPLPSPPSKDCFNVYLRDAGMQLT